MHQRQMGRKRIEYLERVADHYPELGVRSSEDPHVIVDTKTPGIETAGDGPGKDCDPTLFF